ncbi:hypothetical protein EK21DRAFT_84823 [Setomelanomma holmii]|uniref:Uncharacterized protein n=1 Tax=Setomelanomma holmii TaxID=210430 RepID=A0A9P4HIV6_9PLEO|nr:hypothetical protein EK21DRAFT_84823 [Setomelanomma holmii]
MAWFALSLRSPGWWSPSPPSPSPSPSTSRSSSLSPPASPTYTLSTRDMYFPEDAMYMPRLPARPADVYTVRIVDPNLRPGLLKRLREVVRGAGGIEIVELVGKSGFIFSTPHNAQDPLTGYQHGGLLEEGCIDITKTVLEKENKSRRCDSSRSSDEEEEEADDGHGRDHPNLKLQWEWTERQFRR